MPLRATSGPAPSTKSAKVGQRVEFTAKVENTGSAPETLVLSIEELKEGALGKPVEFAFSFDPPATDAKPKTRTNVAFGWIASLPEGKAAFTFRGKIVLRATDGRLVGSAPLDLYVSG